MITVSNREHWLIEQSDQLNEKTAVIFESVQYSYSDVLNLSKQAASYFIENGISKFDHVSVVSSNNLDFILAVNGLWFIGAVPILLNIRLNNEEIKKSQQNSKSKFLVNISNSFDNEKFDSSTIIDFNKKSLSYKNEPSLEYKFDPNSICLMMFTSGSTGEPKCVQLTFDNLYASAKSADSFIDHNNADIWLAALPFYHIGGFSIITRTIISGCSMVIPKALKDNDLYTSIEKYKPSLLSLVPTMLGRMIDKGMNPWENLRILFVGGGAATENLISRALKKKWPIVTVYGSTETASMVTVSSTKNLEMNGMSAGVMLDSVEISISDSEFNNDTSGEIVVSSKSVAHSYLNLTHNETSSLKDGKYFSNDIGKIDSNGNLYIIGRKDEIIISGGENISLAEIENLLNKERNIQDCAVLGVFDEKWGQSYVVITESKENNVKNEIYKFLKERLVKFKLPRKIYKLDEIPRNELGKIQKNKIKELINVDFL